MQNHSRDRTPDSLSGTAILMLCNFVGMVDLVALPVWMGALVQHFGFDLAHAGMTVTSFLVGVVGASVVAAPRFNRLPHQAAAVGGYGCAALAFAAASQVTGFGILAGLHLLGGISIGTGLSTVTGTIGRSANPHRLFAISGSALGLGALAFYAFVPPAVAAHGGSLLFKVFAGMMAAAAVASIGFPYVTSETAIRAKGGPLSGATWCAIFGMICMTVNQALTFSMLDRIGMMRGFGQEQVNQMLLVIGIVNLLPAALAGFLQRKLNPVRVALVAVPLQATLAVTIALATSYAPYAFAASVYAAVLIFAYTFLFGLLARLDPSGRAAAAMPAMMMSGSAVGPALAGAVAMRFGFDGLAVLALLVGAAAFLCFLMVARGTRTMAPAPAGAVD